MLVGVRENVATLKRQGRTRDEIVAAKPTAAYDAKFGGFVIDPGFFTRLVYEGVWIVPLPQTGTPTPHLW